MGSTVNHLDINPLAGKWYPCKTMFDFMLMYLPIKTHSPARLKTDLRSAIEMETCVFATS